MFNITISNLPFFGEEICKVKDVASGFEIYNRDGENETIIKRFKTIKETVDYYNSQPQHLKGLPIEIYAPIEDTNEFIKELPKHVRMYSLSVSVSESSKHELRPDCLL